MSEISAGKRSLRNVEKKILNSIEHTMTDRASANTKSNAMPERYRETILPTTVECWDEMDEMTKKINSAILVSHIIRIPGSARTHFPRTRRKVTWTMPLSPCLCCHVQLHNSRQPSFRRRLIFSRTQSSLHCHVLFSRSQPSFNPRVLFSCTLSSFYHHVLFSRSQLSFRRMLISRSRSLFRRHVLFSGIQPSFHRRALYSAAASSPANARSSADAGSTTTACSIAIPHATSASGQPLCPTRHAPSIWFLHQQICQSRWNRQVDYGSNACTFMTLLLVRNIAASHKKSNVWLAMDINQRAWSAP